MHVSRIACLMLGAWIGGSMFMSAVATQNFRSVERVLVSEEPGSQEAVNLLGGPDAARTFLRHHVGEQNRFYFVAWEYVQLGLGLALALLLLFGSHQRKRAIAVSVLMLAIVCAMRFSVSPAITSLGRELDFLPAAQAALIRNQFRAWHSAYAALEVTKLVFGAILAVILVAGNGYRRRLPADDVALREARR